MITLQKFTELQGIPEGVARMLAETLPGLEDRTCEPPTPALQLILHCHNFLRQLRICEENGLTWLCGKISQDKSLMTAVQLAEKSAVEIEQGLPGQANPGNQLQVLNATWVTWTGCTASYNLRTFATRTFEDLGKTVYPVAIYTLLIENCYLEFRRLCLKS